ncbi:MAG: sensor histidine kinase, partial [Candidatus Micrarchaeaceae archaeon]
MQNALSFKSLKAHTVQNRFTIIVALIVLILALTLVNFWFSVHIMSGIRAYVGGEGLWSKAQKEAVDSLVRYTNSYQEGDYQQYAAFLRIPLGDKQARLELDQAHPNYVIIRDGFIQGGNSPGDLGDLTFLYRNFHRVSYMHSAIAIWTQGDVDIAGLQGLASRIHGVVSDTSLPMVARQTQTAALITNVYNLDTRLTVLEDQFSATLGSGSRHIADALLRITIITTGLLGLLTVAIAALIARALIHIDKVKTEFVSLASHQLRTPLTAINWYAESLADEPQSGMTAKQKAYVAELYKSGRRMSGLITDLLSVSSLDLGTYTSKIAPVDVRVLLDT